MALRASRIILVVMGVSAFVIALDPPQLVGLFAQMGVYGLVAASLVPVAGGIFFENLNPRFVFAAAIVGPLVHFAHYGWVTLGKGEILNPAIPATEGIAASVVTLAALTALASLKKPGTSPAAAPLRVEAGRRDEAGRLRAGNGA